MGMKDRAGDLARSATGARRMSAAGVVVLTQVALLALLMLGVTGCALNAAVAAPTPATTVGANSAGTPGGQPTLTLPTLTAAASPSGSSGTGGAAEICSRPANVTIHPGGNIPIYPGANLHLSQANGSNAFYGFCTGDSPSTVQNFYAQQLPLSGWSGLQTSTIATVVQITASQGTAQCPPKIIVTISPDAVTPSTTSISIVTLASGC